MHTYEQIVWMDRWMDGWREGNCDLRQAPLAFPSYITDKTAISYLSQCISWLEIISIPHPFVL